MYEENFDEMQWALEEHTEKELLMCEKIFHDITKQFTACYTDNLNIIL